MFKNKDIAVLFTMKVIHIHLIQIVIYGLLCYA